MITALGRGEGTTVAQNILRIDLIYVDQVERGTMQVQAMGGSITLPGQRQTRKFDVPCATELIVKLSNREIRRGDYPCGCRLCREAAVAAVRRPSNPLAAIDVYDLPDEVAGESGDYFH